MSMSTNLATSPTLFSPARCPWWRRVTAPWPSPQVSVMRSSLVTMSQSNTCHPGLLCDLLVRQASLPVVAPFLTALPCLGAALLVITAHWPENFGNSSDSLLKMYKEGVSIIMGDSRILRIGLVQASVESSMFIFVYLWTPTLSVVMHTGFSKLSKHSDIRVNLLSPWASSSRPSWSRSCWARSSSSAGCPRGSPRAGCSPPRCWFTCSATWRRPSPRTRPESVPSSVRSPSSASSY